MPEKWDDAREKRLLLEVIATLNPTIERSTWASIAAAMGEGLTGEACRQKFQGIKRNLKALNGDATPNANSTSTPKAAKVTKPKTPTSATATTTATGTKGRKRKAAEAAIDEADDEESTLFTPKAQKAKKEKAANGKLVGAEIDAIGAEVFKAEEEGEGVDLERDDLYDDAA